MKGREVELEKFSPKTNQPKSSSTLTKEKQIHQLKVLNNLITRYKFQMNKRFHRKKGQPLPRNVSLPSLQSSTQAFHEPTLNTPETFRSINKQTTTIKAKDKGLDGITDLKKIEKAKVHKNGMILLSDNVKLYQNQIRKENVKRREVVVAKKKIIFDSMMKYKKHKKDQLNLVNSIEIEELAMINKSKMKEKDFWKEQLKICKSVKTKLCLSPLFLSQKLR